MLKIAIGTKNKAKVDAIQKGFRDHYENVSFECLKTASNVSEQPFSDQETIEGALNRAKNVIRMTEADIGIGLEGGVTESLYGMFLCNWGGIVDRNGNEFIAGGARILLPAEIGRGLRQGRELGPLMDEFTQRTGIRQSEGAVGIFTEGIVTRDAMFLHVVQLLIGQLKYRENQS